MTDHDDGVKQPTDHLPPADQREPGDERTTADSKHPRPEMREPTDIGPATEAEPEKPARHGVDRLPPGPH